ncbi:MAG TPA: PAS domain S-box protein [Casimicrobiaceae bacterium]|nr:PAS domain S-box protein [Casimicrobiaceae bacterium]
MPDAAALVLPDPARFTLAADGTLAASNARARAMLGLEDARSGALLALCPEVQPDGAPTAEAWRQREAAARGGLPQWFSWQFRREDGTPVDALVELERDGDGLAMRLRDLTALRSAERALRDSQARLQQIVDHTSAVVFAKGLDGRYLFGNREFARLAGRPPSAIAGTLDAELFPAEIASAFRAHDAQVLESRTPQDVEERIVVDGRERTFLAHKFPLLAADGRPYAICGIAADITGRKRVEEALRAAALAVSSAEGEDVFHELVRFLATILEVDVAFVAEFADAQLTTLRMLAVILDGRFLRQFEYPLAGSPCANVVGRDFRFVAAGVRQEFTPGTLFEAKGMDSYAALPLVDSAGRPLGLVAVMNRRPMTDPGLAESMLKIFATRATAEIERRRAVEALAQSEASYRAIFEASADAIFVHDWDTGRILDVSRAAERFYGWSVEELKRLSVEDISAGDEGFTQQKALEHLMRARDGENVRIEWRIRHRSGEKAWHEVRIKPATIAGNKRLLAYTRDISAAKAAEVALRGSEERYRAIFEASLDGLALGDEDGRLVDVNPAFLRMLRVEREAVVGADGLRFIVPGLREEFERRFSAAVRGEPCQMEAQGMRVDGTTFDVEVRGVPIEHGGGRHVLVIVRDLTERRRAERERAKLADQLRQAQKMEALGHLTGGIAHDFNNLLTSILGYIALASEREAAEGDQRLARYLDQARASCGRARDLIQQMLTFSRGRRGERRALALGPLVGEAVNLLRASFPASVAIETALDAKVPAVLADPVQLEQVLMNLAINARDAMDGSGRIDVSIALRSHENVECASCRGAFSGTFVELAVRDDGPGIAPGVRERMFEPFFSTKAVGRGSGMGLATVHGIVHDLGGHIVVTSEPGRGARFAVLLPGLDRAADAAPASSAPQRGAQPALAGRVLVVEDEEGVAAFMRDLLESWTVDVTVATDPAVALERFRRDPSAFDAVITDQTMPGMTGLALAKELSSLRAGLPIVLYTGYGEGITPAMLAAAGVRKLLAKPIEPAHAHAALAAILPARPD